VKRPDNNNVHSLRGSRFSAHLLQNNCKCSASSGYVAVPHVGQSSGIQLLTMRSLNGLLSILLALGTTSTFAVTIQEVPQCAVSCPLPYRRLCLCDKQHVLQTQHSHRHDVNLLISLVCVVIQVMSLHCPAVSQRHGIPVNKPVSRRKD
jgi:hypothetical protein